MPIHQCFLLRPTHSGKSCNPGRESRLSCPVSGDLIDPTIYVESPSGPVYFCSPNCRDLYADTPDQYRGGFADSFWYQPTCPVDDNPINPAASTTMPEGETVYF